jgi:hypothetical protein
MCNEKIGPGKVAGPEGGAPEEEDLLSETVDKRNTPAVNREK